LLVECGSAAYFNIVLGEADPPFEVPPLSASVCRGKIDI
jgi:hypothetical protein